mmetsp:Transcript_13736/g.27311  ORF Transcript_13736/g.27311 Transcript_13736/m.27311 type:complete len:210 (+) Transcript_13736:1348-1977(+)
MSRKRTENSHKSVFIRLTVCEDKFRECEVVLQLLHTIPESPPPDQSTPQNLHATHAAQVENLETSGKGAEESGGTEVINDHVSESEFGEKQVRVPLRQPTREGQPSLSGNSVVSLQFQSLEAVGKSREEPPQLHRPSRRRPSVPAKREVPESLQSPLLEQRTESSEDLTPPEAFADTQRLDSLRKDREDLRHSCWAECDVMLPVDRIVK